MFNKKNTPSCGAVIVAAGSGTRMKLDEEGMTGVNKVFLQAEGKPVLAHTLIAFENCELIDDIVLVTRECDIPLCNQLSQEFGISKLKSIVRGGNTRQQSVQNGLSELEDVCEFVAIHDGARCLVSEEEIESVLSDAFEYGAASLGIECKDTLKRAGEDGFIEAEISRKRVYRIQTPQVFCTKQIIEAHKKAAADKIETTDDCSVAAHSGISVKITPGSELNIKITTREDMEIVRAVLEG